MVRQRTCAGRARTKGWGGSLENARPRGGPPDPGGLDLVVCERYPGRSCRDSEHRTGLVNGGDASCLLTVGSSGINKSMLDLEGAASMWPVFAPHLQEAGGMPRSSSTKHRGRGCRSRRSAARASRPVKNGAVVVRQRCSAAFPYRSTPPQLHRWRHEQHASGTRRSLRPTKQYR